MPWSGRGGKQGAVEGGTPKVSNNLLKTPKEPSPSVAHLQLSVLMNVLRMVMMLMVWVSQIPIEPDRLETFPRSQGILPGVAKGI